MNSDKKKGLRSKIVGLVKRIDELDNKINEHRKAVADLTEVKKDCYLRIDEVFDTIQEDHPKFYDEIQIGGRNDHVIKFAVDAELWSITRSPYTNEGSAGRISVKREEFQF